MNSVADEIEETKTRIHEARELLVLHGICGAKEHELEAIRWHIAQLVAVLQVMEQHQREAN